MRGQPDQRGHVMVVVQDMSPKVLPVGGVVRFSGSGFTGSCRVLLDDGYALILDYGDDFLEFEAPARAGTHSVMLRQAEYNAYSAKIDTVSCDDAKTWSLPARDESDFRNALLGLLPRGFAWFTGKLGNWWKLFSAFASGFVELYNNLIRLVDEMTPLKTTSFAEWERELGLPIRGFERSTDAGRKNEIMRIARRKGGCSVSYIKSLLDLYGANYELYEFWQNPEHFPSWVPALGDEAYFYVLVKVYTHSYYPYGANCKSPCNASLGRPLDAVLESIIDQAKPAHIKFIYRYAIQVLTDDLGNPLTDNAGHLLIA